MARAVTARELRRTRQEQQQARQNQRIARRQAAQRGQPENVQKPAGRGWVDSILGR